MAQTTTIRDVAKKAGVGVGTVSRVLNNSAGVSESTRQKVLQAIEELDYRPSPVARRLSTGGRSMAIGIIIPYFTRPAFVGRLQGVEAVLANSPYDLILYNTETPERRDHVFYRIPLERRVDGLLIISLNLPQQCIDLCNRFKIPIVLVDSEHPDHTSISIDDIDGGSQVIRHLVELGHRKIAYISDLPDELFGSQASRKRLEGMKKVLAAEGISFNPAYHKQGAHSRVVAHELTHELLSLNEPPTAIFAASDTQALGVIEAVQQRGLRVPEDISVVGYDDIEVAKYVGLTTVHQPLAESGEEGITSLLNLLDHDYGAVEPVFHKLPVELVVRESTAPPARA